MTLSGELRAGSSYRRALLDRALEEHVGALRGTVLDLGGKKENPRGRFQARESAGWVYLNIDAATHPHVFGDAHELPLRDASVDAVLSSEVLEHVRDAGRCVDEVFRVLKPGGRFLFSVPFLYPLHADPHDFRRFTADGIRDMCARFESVRIEPMGSWLGTVGMFLDLGARSITGGITRVVLRRLLRAVGRLLCVLDARAATRPEAFTTGYFCIAIKPYD